MPPTDRPNVLLIITDDQGYGDLSCHGNPILRTPALDRLHEESLRLTNFHVGPTCAPTRAGLLTGRYCNCTGVWHTIGGRSLLRAGEHTLAESFQAAGYRTALFGKWHLGDNYPFRPHDRGFQTAIYHGGGGVGQTPDYWGNDYFDDTYYDRGQPVRFSGYCTDVWFRLATQFIEAHREEPFFCYLSTNAPHAPYRVDPRYAAPYRLHVPEYRANFYGMIANIDENVARLRDRLERLGLAENTLLIFTTDNGTAAGCRVDAEGFVQDGYNAGMRGMKGWEYDGGHRVPCFLHWPARGWTHGRDVPTLTAHIDLFPTLAELCGLPIAQRERLHGRSLVPLLENPDAPDWPDRVLVTDSQRVERPIKWRKSAVMTQRWRLINGQELYDVQADPEQRHDVAQQHPAVVQELRKAYEAWWEIVSVGFAPDPAIVLGTPHEPETRLTSHDWHNESSDCAWNQGQIRAGYRCNGDWAVEIAETGLYEIELRRWPREEDRALTAGIPGEKIDWYHGGRAIPVQRVRVRLGDFTAESTLTDQPAVVFRTHLKKGPSRLQTWMEEAGQDPQGLGSYYVYVRRVGGVSQEERPDCGSGDS